MHTRVSLTPRLYFSYGQFMVYDQSVAAPGCLWTASHTAQGFARRESTVCFRTLFECGYADVTSELGSFVNAEIYERVIAVPFLVVTGTVVIDGPDENNVRRIVNIPNGTYRLIAAQCAIDDEGELIELFFEKRDEPLKQSAVIVADRQLNVPDSLLELADIA